MRQASTVIVCERGGILKGGGEEKKRLEPFPLD